MWRAECTPTMTLPLARENTPQHDETIEWLSSLVLGSKFCHWHWCTGALEGGFCRQRKCSFLKYLFVSTTFWWSSSSLHHQAIVLGLMSSSYPMKHMESWWEADVASGTIKSISQYIIVMVYEVYLVYGLFQPGLIFTNLSCLSCLLPRSHDHIPDKWNHVKVICHVLEISHTWLSHDSHMIYTSFQRSHLAWGGQHPPRTLYQEYIIGNRPLQAYLHNFPSSCQFIICMLACQNSTIIRIFSRVCWEVRAVGTSCRLFSW